MSQNPRTLRRGSKRLLSNPGISLWIQECFVRKGPCQDKQNKKARNDHQNHPYITNVVTDTSW